MSIKIVVDSTADLPESFYERYNLGMVSLKVHADDKTFLDWQTIKPKEFYKMIREMEGLPTTSQPSPAEFMEVYKEIASESDSIISIHIGSKLSGTYQSAMLAKSMMPEYDITVIDSCQATSGIGLLALKAAQAVEAGKTKEEVIKIIEAMIDNQKTLFMVDSLEYLQKGGRIGKAGALIGSLLNIKPILSLDIDGGVMAADKARGRKKAEKTMIEMLKNTYGDRALFAAVCHADAREEATAFIELAKEELNIEELIITEIGSVIGTHVGPGTYGIIVHEQALSL